MKSSRSRGFTLIETITATTLISVLAATAVPVAQQGKETAKRSKCANNVRQIALHLISKANLHPDKNFPANTNSGSWAWDVGHTTVRDLVSRSGREVLYCPFSFMTTSYPLDALYNYRPNTMAVTTYVLLIPGTKQISNGPAPTPDYLSERLLALYTSGSTTIPAAQRPLVVDAVVSNGNNFTAVGGGLNGNVSNHMAGSLPAGGHAAFVDGSVRWRNFQRGNITNLYDPNFFNVRVNSGTPTFWF